MGKKIINVLCPASIALRNDSSIYFDTENGFSLGPGKHKNAGLPKTLNTCNALWELDSMLILSDDQPSH